MSRCEEAQTRNWVSPLNGERFYNSLFKAEVSIVFPCVIILIFVLTT